jgi:hypothetical protein|tara:strand:- start:153 stop:410 length:258 start_codon:yes stop_codon:yes gene_type:complete
MTNKNYCYIKVPETVNGEFHDQWRLARVYENESGYYPYGKQNKDDPLEFDKFVGSADYVDAIVNAWNERLGITKDRADQIKSTTF